MVLIGAITVGVGWSKVWIEPKRQPVLCQRIANLAENTHRAFLPASGSRRRVRTAWAKK